MRKILLTHSSSPELTRITTSLKKDSIILQNIIFMDPVLLFCILLNGFAPLRKS